MSEQTGPVNNFFYVTKMTEEFRKLKADHLIENPMLIHVWDLRMKLAIAQQLSVISGHLAEILEKSKKL